MPKRIDLTGRVFDDLEVVKLSDKTDKENKTLWECKCSCGNTIYVHGYSLLHGHYKSCGCKHAEKLYKGALEHIKKDAVDGTRKSALKSKLHKNNKSGHKGVIWLEDRQKWKAYICIKGKNKNLGYFHDKEDAIKARQRAEEEYHQPYLDK